MPERIHELETLAAAAEEAPMLPANEIRRRGDRRRTTRRAGLSVAAVGVIAALGTGVWAASPVLFEDEQPTWADSPTPTPTSDPTTSPQPEPTPTDDPDGEAPVLPEQPTWANVPSLALVYPYGSSMVEVLGEYEEIGDRQIGLCDPGALGEPTTVLVREFGIQGELPTYAIVLGYADEEAASQGYDRIFDAAVGCETQMTEAGWDRTSVAEDTRLPFDPSAVDATPARASYFFGMAVKEGEDVGVFNDTMVLQAGERVAWLVTSFEGMDNNCSVLPDDDAMQCSFARSLPDVTELLVQ